MARKKLSVNIDHLDKIKNNINEALGLTEVKRPFKIFSATITDGFCHYGFEVTEGVGLGDKHPSVKGAGLYKEDMGFAFGRLHVHLACIDDAFKLSNVEIDSIDNFHTHELSALYHVTGIKISGSEENETVVITGSKHITCTGGRIAISTPKIPIDDLSSYVWHQELNELITLIREEVALYKEGKCTLPDSEEEESHRSKSKRIMKQMTIADQLNENEEDEDTDSDTDPDDENDVDGDNTDADDLNVDLENNRV